MMRVHWRTFAAVSTLLVATALVFARGGHLSARRLEDDLPDSSYDVVDTDYLIKPLGWRNVTVAGGTLGTDAVTDVDGAFVRLTARSVSTATQVSVNGEAGYEVEWHGATPPPSSLDIYVSETAGFHGGSGAIGVDTTGEDLSYDLAQFPELSDSATTVSRVLKTVSLSQSPDGVYRGQVWTQSSSLSVTGPSSGDRTSGTLTFFATGSTEDPDGPVAINHSEVTR